MCCFQDTYTSGGGGGLSPLLSFATGPGPSPGWIPVVSLIAYPVLCWLGILTFLLRGSDGADRLVQWGFGERRFGYVVSLNDWQFRRL